MRYSELSGRYAKALYDFAADSGSQDKVFADLRTLADLFNKDSEILRFIETPLVRPESKEKAFKQALNGSGVSEDLINFVLLLAKKGRLGLFSEIVDAFEYRSDEAHGVSRGVVRSASTLGPEERKQIEAVVAKETGRQVILTYKEDPSLIGGLVARVGSYTFDDALTSHLNRLKEELNRRTH